jgi:hypothetical protein
VRKLRVCRDGLDQLVRERCPELFTLLEECNYLPLEPFCNDQFDRLSMHDRLAQVEQAEKCRVLLLAEEERELVPVDLLCTRIQRMIREELEKASKKKLPEKERLPCFYIKGKESLTRVFKWQVIFEDEDRALWLAKIVDACERRRHMDSLVRMNCYIDNMPTRDIPPLASRLTAGIIDRIKIEFSKEDFDGTFQEVEKEYGWLQNYFIFCQYLRSEDSARIFSKPLSLPAPLAREVPQVGKLQLTRSQSREAVEDLMLSFRRESKSFQELSREFGLNYLKSLKEVKRADERIEEANLRAMGVSLFDCKYTDGYIRIEEFRASQESISHKGVRRVVDGWTRDLQEIIREELKAGKDSCPLPQEPLKRYLGLQKLMMGEILSSLIKRNYY